MVRSKRPSLVTTTINDRVWKIRFEKKQHRDIHGDCDWTNRVIRIFRSERNKYEPETVVHELLHAAFPKMSEDDVMRAGADITEALCKINLHFTQGMVRGPKEFV